MDHAEPLLAGQRHRLAVCTDLTSMEAGRLEPDDAQSFIRLLLHLDGIDLEAFCPGSALGHGQVVHGEAIAHRLIDAYAAVRSALAAHDPRYPHPDDLRTLVHAGQPVADRELAPERSVGPGLDTAASRHLIRCIDRPDPRPLHVCLWGGAADIAQALWRIRADRGPAGLAIAAARVRVHAIGDQDSAAAWAKTEFPEVPWITRRWGYRGMYRGGEVALAGAGWLRQRILPHGPLCALYPVYDGGDIWSNRLGRVSGIKEGDTPSWLGLIPNGLHIPARPEWGGWGGRVRGDGPARWTCEGVADALPGDAADPRPEMSGVHRWRRAVQAAFALRARRCTAAPGTIPVEPAARIAGSLVRPVAPGANVELDATASTDPGGGALSFRWWIYAAAGTAIRLPELAAADQAVCRVRVPAAGLDGEVHLVLECRGGADPDLVGYARTVLVPQTG